MVKQYYYSSLEGLKSNWIFFYFKHAHWRCTVARAENVEHTLLLVCITFNKASREKVFISTSQSFSNWSSKYRKVGEAPSPNVTWNSQSIYSGDVQRRPCVTSTYVRSYICLRITRLKLLYSQLSIWDIE